MSRRRRIHPSTTDVQPVTHTTVAHTISPALVRQDLLKVTFIYIGLLALLGAAAYWQSRSGVPTQIGHAMRLFLGF